MGESNAECAAHAFDVLADHVLDHGLRLEVGGRAREVHGLLHVRPLTFLRDQVVQVAARQVLALAKDVHLVLVVAGASLVVNARHHQSLVCKNIYQQQ